MFARAVKSPLDEALGTKGPGLWRWLTLSAWSISHAPGATDAQSSGLKKACFISSLPLQQRP